jgi:hypothetical protein
MRRRIQIWTSERIRIRRQAFPVNCPICFAGKALLTLYEAQSLLDLTEPSVRRLLAQGKAHGVMTVQGQLLVCRRSLDEEAGPIRSDKKEKT